jgi:hypothetical protein
LFHNYSYTETIMLKSSIAISILVLPIFFSSDSFSQGCSDAGFCTIGALKPSLATDKALNNKGVHRISFLTPFGQGDENVFVWNPGLQYDYISSTGWSLQAKVTGNYASGNLGTANGAGDIYLSASKAGKLNERWNFTPTIGVKIPLSQSNISEAGMPLPMQYQSSLGTFDVIAGLTFSDKHWQFSAGYQQPLSGENKNGFLPEYWNGKPESMNYPPSFMFDRKGDLLLRALRGFGNRNDLNFNAGLLAIYHLGEDQYTNPFEGNKVLPVNGSSGLTLNLTGAAYWQAGKRTRVGITAGVPLIVRDVRPDGLTRSWVVAPEISLSF